MPFQLLVLRIRRRVLQQELQFLSEQAASRIPYLLYRCRQSKPIPKLFQSLTVFPHFFFFCASLSFFPRLSLISGILGCPSPHSGSFFFLPTTLPLSCTQFVFFIFHQTEVMCAGCTSFMPWQATAVRYQVHDEEVRLPAVRTTAGHTHTHTYTYTRI